MSGWLRAVGGSGLWFPLTPKFRVESMGLHESGVGRGRTDVVTSSGDRMCGLRLTAALTEGAAVAFGSFICRYGGFFRTRDNAAVAERALQGLAQAEEATFAAMAT